MLQFCENSDGVQVCRRYPVEYQTARSYLMERPTWKVRPADLRRMAAKAAEPERERKLLALAEELEERGANLELNAKGSGEHSES